MWAFKIPHPYLTECFPQLYLKYKATLPQTVSFKGLPVFWGIFRRASPINSEPCLSGGTWDPFQETSMGRRPQLPDLEDKAGPGWELGEWEGWDGWKGRYLGQPMSHRGEMIATIITADIY